MAVLTIYIEIGDVIAKLTLIETRLDDPTVMMKDLLLLGIRSTGQNFQAQGRPARWDDLAPSTERRRFARAARARGASSRGSLAILASIRILQNTGLLLQSVGGGASGSFSKGGGTGESSRYEMSISTNNPGAWNQFPNLRTGAPARVMILWQPQDVEDASDMQNDFIMHRGPYAL